MQDLSHFRNQFPHTQQNRIYLNHAAISPFPNQVIEAINRHLNERNKGKINNYEGDLQVITSCRQHIASLLHLESINDLALVPNTSEALSIVASGIHWNKGDRILINDLEFPANVYPFLNLRSKGVEVDVISHENGRITPSMIENALRPETRLVAISAVQFLSGYRADLATIGKICRDHGALFIVDAIQAVGAIDLNLNKLPVDVLAAGAHKWQFGPQGMGFLFITEKVRNQIEQQHMGWLSVENPWELFNHQQSLDPTAKRYENGTMNIPGIYGYEASLSLLLSAGITNIESKINELTSHLLNNLESLKPFYPYEQKERAGIVTFRLPDKLDPEELRLNLAQNKIDVAIRNGMLRISPHFYNTIEEIETAVNTIYDCLESKKL